jgi:chemotaxis response regulator CheB
MTMADGRLRLQLRADEAQRKPIDVFLSSLTEEHGEASIGVLLSGGAEGEINANPDQNLAKAVAAFAQALDNHA